MKKIIIPLMFIVLFATEWETFIRALIWVESRNNPEAVSRCNAVGMLQITPIYVKEANRLLKEERYTLDDRKDLQKSLEMFEIINAHYNPTRDIDKAIRLHNPKAGPGYSKAIKERMKYDSDNNRTSEENPARTNPGGAVKIPLSSDTMGKKTPQR